MSAFTIYTDSDGDNHFSKITSFGSYPACYLGKNQIFCPYCACERFEMEDEDFTRHAVHSDESYCEDCGCDLDFTYED